MRNFFIGSEWLYYKIYTGPEIADSILIEKITPLISYFKKNGYIEKWFFIRYSDPDNHLRIRFYNQNSEELLKIIPKLYKVINGLIQEDIIWKIQVDTYQKEIERYGQSTMSVSETFFYHDSEMMLKYLKAKKLFINDSTPIFFSILSINNFLSIFNLSIDEKLRLIDGLQLSFKKEFDASKTLKKQFDKNYRLIKPELFSFINNTNNDFYAFHKIVNTKEKKIKKDVENIKNIIEIPLNSFLFSHIHMMINRQFTSNQRQYECLIYDHLYRFYKEENFKPKK